MAYVWQRWLADEFRAAGLTVIETAGWKNRGRPASTGSFNPSAGVVNHHTGTTASKSNPAPAINILIKGRSDLPGPIAHYSVDFLGRVWIIAAGRANVNGRVGKSGVIGFPFGADGNALGLGNEVQTNGTQALSPAQLHAIAVTNRVVIDHFHNKIERIVRHKDISGTGKWDLGSRNTAQLRSDAQKITIGDDDDMKPSEIAGAPIKMLSGPKNVEKTVTLQEVLRDLEGTQDKQGAQLNRIEKLLKDAIAAGKS